ncbi:exported hypothetical protein [metagenome]|uniref:Uncharacterized protein n=1 Tax=metagenome TaxID=256318 RepID=A0A2P2C3N6_9ZZZZ
MVHWTTTDRHTRRQFAIVVLTGDLMWTRSAQLLALSTVTAFAVITAAPAMSSAASPGFTYKDRQIAASLNGPENPAAGLPGIELISGNQLQISGSDILAYRAAGVPALDASASLTGGWLGCDTASDELVNVTYNGSSALPEGSVTVASKLTTGSLAATWPVQVVVERTPGCAAPDFSLSTTTELTETVHVELTVASDGSPSVSSSYRDPAMGERVSTTTQAGTVVRVLLDGEQYVPDWSEQSPYTVAASLSATSFVQR